jgi:hypothetical protein
MVARRSHVLSILMPSTGGPGERQRVPRPLEARAVVEHHSVMPFVSRYRRNATDELLPRGRVGTGRQWFPFQNEPLSGIA